MLIRALLISVLFHIVILLSANHLDGVVPPAAFGLGAGVLKMSIATRDKLRLPSPEVSKQRMSNVLPESAVRASASPLEPKTKHLKIAPIFQSTVEVTNADQVDSGRSPDFRLPEPPSASVEDLGQYRLNVARSARQFKVYPSQARENDWEGVVHVSIAVSFGVGHPVVSLGRTSGHAVLDLQALEMVERAVSLADMPEGMRGRSLSISLPVEYRLAD